VNFLLIVIAAFSLGYAYRQTPQPYVPPDLAQCQLAHGFVIGEPPFNPGAVEIWKCRGRVVVTLNELQGLWPNRYPETRSHLTTEAGPGEEVVGCRGFDENYPGIVAVASGAGTQQEILRRAWRADLEKWQFVRTPTADLVCNRGLTVD
jgi:hypothetical protein